MAVPDYMPCWYDSSEIDAPAFTNVAGSGIALLDALLVNGYKVRAVSQIVVTGGVAVATAANHGYTATYGKLLLIEGAPQAGLNGRVQPTEVTTNTFTFSAPGVPDGTYSGSISAKRAPLGWVKAHAGANAAIYARSDPSATGSLLRVVDTRAAPAHAQYMRVTMVATATDVDTFTNETPPDANNPFWSGGSSASAQAWALCGDSKRFWIRLPASAPGMGNLYWFGDPVAIYPGDAGGCLIVTHGISPSSGGSAGGGLGGATVSAFQSTGTYTRLHFHRALSGAVQTVLGGVVGAGAWGNAGPSGDVVIPITSDFYVRTSSEVRARWGGLHMPQGSNPFNHLEVYDFPGAARKLLCFPLRADSAGAVGQVMLDVTGPWG